MLVDGRGNSTFPTNSMDTAEITWKGGLGNDEMDAYFTSAGDTTIHLTDDTLDVDGTDQLNLYCADFACNLLSRENFVANLHDLESLNTSTVERIDILRDEDGDGWQPHVSIQSLFVDLNDGENSMFFDDTMAQMQVYGGKDADSFYVGQLYNSPRDEINGNVQVSDPISTTETTKGYLSDGNSHPITINGQGGGDVSCLAQLVLV